MAPCFLILAVVTAIFRPAYSADKSIAFVLDTTGSMSSLITAAREGAERIFEALTAKDSDIQNYVVVPFNDPGTGPATVTEDRDVFLTTLRGLGASGGGDCPELAMGGVKLALENVHPRSSIFVFTDASAKDYSLVDEVLSLVQQKQTRVIFVLTGECTSNAADPTNTVYETIASGSNGHVFHVDTSDVSTVVNFITAHQKEVALESLDLESLAGSEHELETMFSVDPKIAAFAVSVSGKNLEISIFKPDGTEFTNYTKIVDLTNAKVISVNLSTTSEPYGKWKVMTKAAKPYSIRITGMGSMEFQYGFTDSRAADATVTKRPDPGTTAYVVANLTGITTSEKVEKVMIEFVNSSGSVALSLKASKKTHADYSYTAGPTSFPAGLFRMKISGKLPGGYNFQRITSTSISIDEGIIVTTPCPTEQPPSKSEMIEALDDNGDSKLSPAEARNCRDCRLKCFCNGMKHAFNLEENQPDYDGDGLFSSDEIPDPPDDAPYLPSSPPTARQIFRTVNRNRDDGLSKKELRACLRRYCDLNCACKRMLETFDERAGGTNSILH